MNLNCSLLLLLVGVTLVAGCGQSDPAVFRLNMPEVVANQIIPDHQQSIANILQALFGTPDEPFAPDEAGLNLTRLKMAAGPVWSDEQGVGYGLYRQHCAHCHGVNGDGRGPTAMFLNPYPRDYRQGVFKFKSTYNPARPTDDDLRQVLLNGVPGTAMPSFALLAPGEIDALVEYVKYLSMRGQMELALIQYVALELDRDDPFDIAADEEHREVVLEELEMVVASWEEAEDQVIVPEDDALPAGDRSHEEILASAEKGRELFYGTRANCIKCHGPTALGDGQQNDYDIWNKAVVNFQEETEAVAERLPKLEGEDYQETKENLASRRQVLARMLPPRNAIPRNLRRGMYRGGQRPLDIYRKVYTGVAGTPMPGSGPVAPGAQGTLSEEEMWQIVDYVRSLPFEPASQPQHLRVNYEVLN